MKLKITLLLLLSSFILPPSSFSQGPLPPPGPPGPTMKSLDQIDTHVAQAGEKRIPIDAAHTPGDAKNDFIIKAAGSYYLTGNLTAEKSTAIQVKVPGVTVDLNGFQLAHSSTFNGDTIGPTGRGIALGPNCTIRNGFISRFDTGIFQQLATDTSHGGRVEGISVSDCLSAGILLGFGWTVDRCTVHHNAAVGIAVGGGSVLIDCAALFNGGTGISVGSDSVINRSRAYGNVVGIKAEPGSTIVNCTAAANISDGIQTDAVTVSGSQSEGNGTGDTGGAGLVAGNGSVISDCAVSGNKGYGIFAGNGCTVNNSTAHNNTGASGIGIRVADKSTITGCTVDDNAFDGIQFISRCYILNNTVSNNGTGASGDGLHSFGANNRIDGNTSEGNKTAGIRWTGTDIVVRNSAQNNAAGSNYVPASGTGLGPVAAGPSTATSPWANFQ